MVVSREQVQQLADNGQMYCRRFSSNATYDTVEESRSRLPRQGLFIDLTLSENDAQTDSALCTDTTLEMTSRGQTAGKQPRAIKRHSVSTEPTTDNEENDTYDHPTKPSNSCPLSPINGFSYPTLPYVSPMMSPVSVTSFLPLPISAFLTLPTSPNSPEVSVNTVAKPFQGAAHRFVSIYVHLLAISVIANF